MFAAVVSVIALVFAAIAALRTVQLTRQMQIEGRVQRLSEALVQVIEAARQARMRPGQSSLLPHNS